MGADYFRVFIKGDDVATAFTSAVKDAQYEYGHRGYTGMIAEKADYTLINLPSTVSPEHAMHVLRSAVHDEPSSWWLPELQAQHEDKWGPALAIQDVQRGGWWFVGYASS